MKSLDWNDEQLIQDELPKEAPRVDLILGLQRAMDRLYEHVMEGGSADNDNRLLDDALEFNDVQLFPAGVKMFDRELAELLERAKEAKNKREEEQRKKKAAEKKPAPVKPRKPYNYATRARQEKAKKTAKTKPGKRQESYAGIDRTTAPSLIDRHIARASKAPRAKRASPSKEPCVRLGERHRYGDDGKCRNRDASGVLCPVPRGGRTATAAPSSPPPARRDAVEGVKVCFVPPWTGGDMSICGLGIAKKDAAHRAADKARVTCEDCLRAIDAGDPSTKPPKPAAKPKKGLQFVHFAGLADMDTACGIAIASTTGIQASADDKRISCARCLVAMSGGAADLELTHATE